MKANQPKLLAAIRQTAASSVAVQYCQTSEQSRGRQLERVLELFKASQAAKAEWPGLEWFIRLVRKGKRQGQAFERVSYYICSYQKANAAMLAAAIRGHWGIENRLHWEKDVTLKEDRNGIRKGQAPENLSLLKNMAINLARKSGYNSIKEAIIAFANKIKIMAKLIRT
nr:ISAs1 family transposase [Adhaeribacter rhizoryzae]